MTLVVASNAIPEIPIMFSDCLTSSLEYKEENKETEIPSKTYQHEDHPIELFGTITGLRRKMCIVRPNLVIGWSGTMAWAEIFYKKLEIELSKNEYDNKYDEAINFVYNEYKSDFERDEDERLGLDIIYIFVKGDGTIINGQHGCNIKKGISNRYGHCRAIGSGAKSFIDNLSSNLYEDNPVHLVNDIDSDNEISKMRKIAFDALYLTYNAFGQEYFDNQSSSLYDYYGGMYETIIYNRELKAFEYVDDIQVNFTALEQYAPNQYRDWAEPMFYETIRKDGELIMDRFSKESRHASKTDFFFKDGYILKRKSFVAANIGNDCGKSNSSLGKISVMYVFLEKSQSTFKFGTYIHFSDGKHHFTKNQKAMNGRKMFFTQAGGSRKKDIEKIITSFNFAITGQLPPGCR